MTVSRIEVGEEGMEFSQIAAGLWRLDAWDLRGEALADWIKACIDMGVTTFDHADIYGDYTCESIFGEALSGRSYLRDKMEIVTKCDIMLISENRPDNKITHYDTTQAHIVQSVEQSLLNLKTDYIDLLLLHRPDPLMDADEVAETFIDLWESGKVRHFGVSNFTNSQFSLLDSRLPDFDLVTNQIEFSPLHTEPMYDGTLDWCQMLGISPMAWSPFAGGRIFSPDDERSQRVYDTLSQLAKKYNAGIDQIVLAWLMMHPSDPIIILGTGKIERVRTAVGAEDIDLSRQDWFRILEASHGEEVP